MIRSILQNGLVKNLKCGSVLAQAKYSDDSPSNSRKERSLNQVTLLGRVGKDAEEYGTKRDVAIFSLATNENWKNKEDQWETRVSWHKIMVSKPSLQETALNYVTKGKRILVHGKLQYQQHETRDGYKVSSATIVANDIVFLKDNE